MKNLFKFLLVMVLCAFSYSANAQLKISDALVEIGAEGYTPVYFGPNWSIEPWEGGLNIWKPYPSVNYGNYKLFISSDGLVGIGKKPTTYKLEVNGSVYISGSYLQTSDARLKTNICPLKESLSKINSLRGVSFTYLPAKISTDSVAKEVNKMVAMGKIKKQDVAKITQEMCNPQPVDKQLHFGVIAQEVEKIFPELVKKGDDGYLSVDYVGLIPVIIESLKEQQAIIAKQNADFLKYKANK